MKVLPNSLFLRLSVILFFLIVGTTVVQYTIFYSSSLSLFDESEQIVQWDIAEYARARVELAVKKDPSLEEAKKVLADLNRLSPRTEWYILDAKGQVIAGQLLRLPWLNAETKKKSILIPTEPLEKFLALPDQRKLPIYNKAVLNPKRNVVFSAARLEGVGPAAYLYVILQSNNLNIAQRGRRGYYIMVSGIKIHALLGLLASITGFVIFLLVTRRFRQLSAGIKRFGAGNYSHRLNANSTDEVGRLAQTVNEMAETIQSSIEELKRKDELRRNLVSNITHDLRSPLSVIQGHVQKIQTGEDSEKFANIERRLDAIARSCQRASGMVEELFELSKLEAKISKPECEVFSLDEMLSEEIFPKYEVFAAESGLNLLLQKDGGEFLVDADPRMIERVLSNLIDNAVKYSEEGGEISVHLSKVQDKIGIEVIDDGIGISQEELPNVFERFYRSDSLQSRSRRGSGLGLAIVKKIIEAHNQSISVSSELGSGSKFEFFLPAGNRQD